MGIKQRAVFLNKFQCIFQIYTRFFRFSLTPIPLLKIIPLPQKIPGYFPVYRNLKKKLLSFKHVIALNKLYCIRSIFKSLICLTKPRRIFFSNSVNLNSLN